MERYLIDFYTVEDIKEMRGTDTLGFLVSRILAQGKLPHVKQLQGMLGS